jgi:uncharacterized protein YaiI (UPF0178 family)
MKIWIDADACPSMVKDVVFNASARTKIPVILVANRAMHLPRSPLISQIVVEKGCDVADSRIVDELSAGDLVITADIPLASLVIAKEATALNPRGEIYTKENIGERLSIRNFMMDLRSSGQISGGPPGLSLQDKKRFAASFDAILTKLMRNITHK